MRSFAVCAMALVLSAGDASAFARVESYRLPNGLQVHLQEDELPLDAWGETDARIQRVTAADIRRMARRYLTGGSPAVVVGDVDVAARLARSGYRTLWDRHPK